MTKEDIKDKPICFECKYVVSNEKPECAFKYMNTDEYEGDFIYGFVPKKIPLEKCHELNSNGECKNYIKRTDRVPIPRL